MLPNDLRVTNCGPLWPFWWLRKGRRQGCLHLRFSHCPRPPEVSQKAGSLGVGTWRRRERVFFSRVPVGGVRT